MGVHLGAMRSGQFACEKPMEDCAGRTFQELRGIVLCRKPGEPHAIAALWSGEFNADRFMEWKRKESIETKTTDTVKADIEKNNSGMKESREIGLKVIEPVNMESVDTESEGTRFRDIKTVDGGSEKTESENIEIVNTDSEKVEPQNIAFENIDSNNKSSGSADSRDVKIEIFPYADSTESHIKNSTSDEKQEEGVISVKCPQETGNEPVLVPTVQEAEDAVTLSVQAEDAVPEPSAEKETKLQVTSMTAEAEQTVQEPPQIESFLWQQMERQYPKMRLQIEGEPVLVLRIRPCDISRLPKYDWKYGCNHFLARHYNQYRCLILGRRKVRGRWRCFLGVPGNHTFPEEQEAAEAGFDRFLQADHVAAGWPKGYWITELPEMN